MLEKFQSFELFAACVLSHLFYSFPIHYYTIFYLHYNYVKAVEIQSNLDIGILVLNIIFIYRESLSQKTVLLCIYLYNMYIFFYLIVTNCT